MEIEVAQVIEYIKQYGFPIIAACGMAFIIYNIWEWATKDIKPVLNETHGVLIELIDKIRFLDHDLVRFNQKLYTISEMRKNSDQ